jgi:hypothetical protein
VNDLREDDEKNTFDLMCVNSDFVSNDINESEFQDENNMNKAFEHDEEL